MKLIVYPVKDLARAKKLYTTLLGAAPYVDMPYYVGFKVGELEIGLDPNGPAGGPIGYVVTANLADSLAALVDAGATVKQPPKDVGGGMLIAQVADADGNILGLRQS